MDAYTQYVNGNACDKGSVSLPRGASLGLNLDMPLSLGKLHFSHSVYITKGMDTHLGSLGFHIGFNFLEV